VKRERERESARCYVAGDDISYVWPDRVQNYAMLACRCIFGVRVGGGDLPVFDIMMDSQFAVLREGVVK